MLNPAGELSEVNSKLRSDEWNLQVKGINILRALAKHHTELLKKLDKYEFSEIVNNLSELAVSLRSFVSKSSIVALSEISKSLSSRLDKLLAIVTKYLFIKSQEKNIFLCKEVDKALSAIAIYSNKFTLLNILIKKAEDKSSVIREKACDTIRKALEAMGVKIFNYKNLQNLHQILAKLLIDSNKRVRSSAKKTVEVLSNLSDNPELTRKSIKKFLPENFKFKDKIRRNTKAQKPLMSHIYQRKVTKKNKLSVKN